MDSQEKNPALLPYGNSVSAPKIEPLDLTSWKSQNVHKANKEISAKWEEIKGEYLKLLEETEWTQQVYQSHFNFEPIVGEIYHLYLSREEKPFLSLISPDQWNKPHLGSFRLETGRKWIKI
jgi:hypothetical protein